MLEGASAREEIPPREPYPELVQCLCQRLDGLHVQMICRLIQDVEVWTGREDGSERALEQACAGTPTRLLP